MKILFRGRTYAAHVCETCPGALKFSDPAAYQRHMAALHGEGYEEKRCPSCKTIYLARHGTKRRWRLCDLCTLRRRRKMGTSSADTGRTHRGVVIFKEGISQGYSRKKI